MQSEFSADNKTNVDLILCDVPDDVTIYFFFF